jgi:transposase
VEVPHRRARRDLPDRFGAWQTAWKRHAKWSHDGTWHRVWEALQVQVDEAGDLEWLVSVDSSLVRVHQHAATLPRQPVRGGWVESHVPGDRAA